MASVPAGPYNAVVVSAKRLGSERTLAAEQRSLAPHTNRRISCHVNLINGVGFRLQLHC